MFNQAYIPTYTRTCSIANIQLSNSANYNTDGCTFGTTEFAIQVSFPIYIIALMSFISWFLFVLFGGIGLAALPLDLIYDFCTRPKKLSGPEMESKKKKILQDSLILRELADETKSMEDRGAQKRNSNNLEVMFSIQQRKKILQSKYSKIKGRSPCS